MTRAGQSALLVALGALAACNTRTVLKPNPQPKTSYEMLIPDTALRYSLAPGETAVQPQPGKQTAPVYPSSLVHLDEPPVTVVAQLVMDKDGHVQGVYPVSDTDKTADYSLFEAAVEHAAMQWTFTPLWMRKPKGGRHLRSDLQAFQLVVHVPLQGRERQADRGNDQALNRAQFVACVSIRSR